MNDDILSLIKCKCNCSGCAGICQNDACRNDGNGTCRKLFQYIQGDFIYRFSIKDDVVKQLCIIHKDYKPSTHYKYSVIWYLDTKKTKISAVKFPPNSMPFIFGFTINSLISPFNISPERIKKLLTFS